MLINNNLNTIYNEIDTAVKHGKKLLAVLIDPDKISLDNISFLINKIKQSPATHIFIGGSIVTNYIIDEIIILLKKEISLPIILFPGDPSQISRYADGILFLNLISGRNSDYLIGHQVNAVSKLKSTNLEIISTGYILIDGGKETAVQRVSQTKPLQVNDIQIIVDTAVAGTWMGNQLIYLEAGSGALHAVSPEVIQQVKSNINVPLIVGGGIRSAKQIQLAYDAGADIVVIGTAFENDPYFFEK
jgi:phosphoglycerol geranylgeranyltransferase